jgi:hypothetical protein
MFSLHHLSRLRIVRCGEGKSNWGRNRRESTCTGGRFLSEFSFAVDRFLSFLPDFEIAHALLFMDRAQSKASSKKKVVFQPNDLRLDLGPRTSLEHAAQPIDMDITIPSTVHQSPLPLRKSKTTRINGGKRRRKETLMSQNSKNI